MAMRYRRSTHDGNPRQLTSEAPGQAPYGLVERNAARRGAGAAICWASITACIVVPRVHELSSKQLDEHAQHIGASFGRQWERFDPARDRTWGLDLDRRRAQFLVDLDLPAQWFPGKRVLDAGCGNGMLTSAIATLGCDTWGVDVSDSVVRAAERYPNVTFRQADLLDPPDLGEFDAIYSGGVLHHTRDTRRGVEEIARMVAPGGRIYVWLYRDIPDSRAYQLKKRLRRGPLWWRQLVAWPFAVQARFRHRDLTLREHYLIEHDFFTPRWRWEHTPHEVVSWFEQAGLEAQHHTTSRDGFGVLARRQPSASTQASSTATAP